MTSDSHIIPLERPKSIKQTSIKLPPELVEIIDWDISRMPPKHRPTRSGWIKTAVEDRLAVINGRCIGCYGLYRLLRGAYENPGNTIGLKVLPDSEHNERKSVVTHVNGR